MAFLRHVDACNNHDPTGFLPFLIDNLQVGRIRGEFAHALAAWSRVFEVTNESVTLSPALGSFDARTQAVATVLRELVQEGVVTHLQAEPYAVTATTPEEGLMLIDRAAAPYFGIRAFGQHLNGYVREGGELKLWVAQRAADRRNYPGKLDNLVAGGLPYGLSRVENLRKECWEEAGIPAELAARARPVGVISYQAEIPAGFKPDTLYCYDLELPGNFVPRCTDGEVEGFRLYPVEEVKAIVRDTDAFKLNCNLVVIDFMMRKGLIGPECPDFQQLRDRLYPSSDQASWP